MKISRLGLGVSNVGPGNGPVAISVLTQMGHQMGVQVDLGLDTRTGSDSMLIGLLYRRPLFLEESQSFDVFIGGGLKNAYRSGANASGYFFEGGFGARFFLKGLPNLGFMLNGGLRVESPEKISLRSFVSMGFHYYL